MTTTKYPGVYKNDDTGGYYYSIELGTDRITGKRVQRKRSRSENGEPFHTAKSAHEEATRIRNKYHEINSFKNYNMTYEQFMDKIFLPYYESDVETSTWESRKSTFKVIKKRFKSKKLREITVEDCELFRIYLINESGYSKSYASLMYGLFRQTLDYAVQMQYLSDNVSKKTKAIPKGKAKVSYWTKEEFEKVISSICIKDFYEHLSFVLLWVYFTTGVRVSEGLALRWSDIDFDNKKLRIHGTLEWTKGKDKTFRVKPYTKTKQSLRTISIDDDTIHILKEWKKRQFKHGFETFIMSYDGTPLVRSTVNRIVNRYSETAGVERIQPKGLRHSHVSYLINEHNIHVLVISKRLGHSSPDITLKYYSHLWDRNDAVVADAITGDINIKPAKESMVDFHGNQFVKK